MSDASSPQALSLPVPTDATSPYGVGLDDLANGRESFRTRSACEYVLVALAQGPISFKTVGHAVVRLQTSGYHFTSPPLDASRLLELMRSVSLQPHR